MNKMLKFVVCATSALMMQTAFAQADKASASAKASAKPAAAKPAVKPASKNHKAVEPPGLLPDPKLGDDDDSIVPDTAASVVTEFNCDLAQSVTFYQNPGDDKHVAVRWNKQLLTMRRVPTTTGADRFENRRYGLVWIGIPAKAMLLDSKKGQQLANGCRNAAQEAANKG